MEEVPCLARRNGHVDQEGGQKEHYGSLIRRNGQRQAFGRISIDSQGFQIGHI